MNYLADIEYASSEKSEDATLSQVDSRSSIDELNEGLTLREQNEERYSQLIDDKYHAILEFNEGELDADIYFGTINKINIELEKIDNATFETNELLIEQELNFTQMAEETNDRLINQQINLKEMLDQYVSKINRIRNINKKVNKGYLDYFDIERLKALRYLIKHLQEQYIEPEQEEIQDLDSFNLEDLLETERLEIEERAFKKGIIKPISENFELKEDYQNELQEYYEKIYILLYFSPYEKKEQSEIEKLAKELKIPKPKEGSLDYESKILTFYNEVSQLLPGYIFKMKPTKIGYTYELLNIDLLKEKIKNDIEMMKDLPIKISLEETIKSKKINRLVPILKKMEQNELINCIMQSDVYVPKIPKVQKGYSLQSIKIKGLTTEGNSLKKNINKTLNPKEYLEHEENIQRKKLLQEILIKYDQLKVKRVVKEIVPNVKTVIKEIVIPTTIPNAIRQINKRRLIQSLQKGIPIELYPFVLNVITRMENYIYNINLGFIGYSNKIEDILFIFDNYPTFKIKLLQPIQTGNNTFKTEINVYQIVLFEKEISSLARIHIFPVSIQNRKRIIKKLFSELFILNPFRSKILNKILSQKWSTKIEGTLFNISGNESEYFYNTKKVLLLIPKSGKEIMYQKLSIEQIIETLRIFKATESKNKELLDKWLNDSSLLSYNDFVEKILPNKIDYSKFSLRELETLINDSTSELKSFQKRRNELDANNYLGTYMLNWDPPSLISQQDRKTWFKMVHNFQSKTDPKIKNILFQELDKYKEFLTKKYNMSSAPEYQNVIKEINMLQQKINNLQTEWNTKNGAQLDLYKKRYINFLQQKYSSTPLPPVIFQEKILKYQNITFEIINELIQTFKRKLILDDSTLIKKLPVSKEVTKEWSGIIFANYDYLPEHITYPNTESSSWTITTDSYKYISDYAKKGKLITYLELYDLNELNNNTIINEQRIIEPILYQKIKKYLTGQINEFIISDYASINIKYKKIAIRYLLNYFNNPIQADTLTELINSLVKNWPEIYVPQNEIVDFYGNDLFYKMIYQNDFYDFMIKRNYQILVKNNTIKESGQFRRPMILFNESKGTFGEAARDGMVYPVEMLDKDPSTGLPIQQTKIIMEKDPRTGNWLPLNKKTYKRGSYAYILRYIGTSQIGTSQETWLEVPKGAVKLYTYDFDSCSNKSELNCSGPGLNNSTCVFANGKCHADYTKPFSFGKKNKKLKIKKK